MTNKILEHVEEAHLKKDVPQFDVGDTVDVHTRIVEGDKERIQVFSGTVIMKKGRGHQRDVHRPPHREQRRRRAHLPAALARYREVVVKRSGETRRAKLFYLRDRVGKAVRLTEKRKVGGKERRPMVPWPAPQPRSANSRRRRRRPPRPEAIPINEWRGRFSDHATFVFTRIGNNAAHADRDPPAPHAKRVRAFTNV